MFEYKPSLPQPFWPAMLFWPRKKLSELFLTWLITKSTVRRVMVKKVSSGGMVFCSLVCKLSTLEGAKWLVSGSQTVFTH